MDRGAGHSVGELARRVGGTVGGDPEVVVTGVQTLDAARSDHLSFLTNPKYRDKAMTTRAGVVMAAPGTELPGKTVLRVAHPYVALAELLELFHPPEPARPGLSPDATRRASPCLARRCSMQPATMWW